LDDRLIPDGALLDPELTVGMPPRLTAATGFDALTHAVEAYTAINRNPAADALAMAAIGLVATHLPVACVNGTDRVARGPMLMAANLAGMAFNAAGVGLVHAMAHVIGARYGVHHGTANAICLPHVIRFNGEDAALAARYVECARALGATPPDPSLAAGVAAA